MIIEKGLAKFLLQLKADGRSEHTIHQYRRHVRLFGLWARDVGLCGDVSKISHEDIARFLASPQARTRADGGLKKASSTNCLRSSLCGFFRYLHQAGWIKNDPTRLTRRAICGASPPRALSRAEQDLFLKALAAGTGYEARRDYALFALMLQTGIRLGSTLALDSEDIDLAEGTLWLRETKGNRPDRIFLGSAIMRHLKIYMKDLKNGPLFPNRFGTRLSKRQVQRRFKGWTKKAGISKTFTAHCLRHAFGTRLYHETKDIFLVQQALRHRSITSTLVYARQDEDRLRQVLQG